MLFPPTTSFTPLSTISLPTSRLLHPRACNPAMDLILLLSPYPAPASTKPAHSWSAKGKGKDEGQTKVSLWRTSGGSPVWEVGVTGRVAGFAWMEDGLHVSLLLVSITQKSVDTLSVHTGETVKSMPLKLEIPDLDDGQWVEMMWNDSGLKWEAPRNGSALMVMESLPRVTLVEPPKPANVLPFMRPVAAALPKQTLHTILQGFPSLLPSKSPIAPTMLQISTQQLSSASLLTGTLSLASDPTPAVLELSQIADQMVSLFDMILRGLENAEAAFREGEKQTMICREDLETCAKQQATSISDVHADLFRHLITGRTGTAVTEWLGNRMTGRTITKWDNTLDTSFRTIQKLISESISPALERLMLLLEQITGWTKTPSYCEQLNLGETVLKEVQNLVGGLAMLVETMRRHAEHEMLAAAEFMNWLRYETMRVVNQERSLMTETQYATHDIKLVWAFMKNGFVHSVFHQHFPNLLTRPPKDTLPEDVIASLGETVSDRRLEDVLDETLGLLGEKMHETREASSAGDDSDMSGSAMSLSGIATEDEIDLDKSAASTVSIPSSPDTVAQKDEYEAPPEIKRVIDVEPWVWVNTVVEKCQHLIEKAVRVEKLNTQGDKGWKDWEGLKDRRDTEDGQWVALAPPRTGNDDGQLWLVHTPSSTDLPSRISALALSDADDSTTCLALQFFDDEELVLLLEEARAQQRYLVTVRYTDILESMGTVPEGMEWTYRELVEMGRREIGENMPVIPITRCRPLSSGRLLINGQMESPKPTNVSIALNGRTGRSLGCVMLDAEEGKEIEVLDLEVDEDAYEEDDMADDDDPEERWSASGEGEVTIM